MHDPRRQSDVDAPRSRAAPSICLAQLRIVHYNTAGAVRPGLATVLEQIGNESVNGG
jgi:hypothetical protein